MPPPTPAPVPVTEIKPSTVTAYVQPISTAPLSERLLSSDSNISKTAQSEIPNLSNDQKAQLAVSILNTVKNVSDPILQTSIANKAGPMLVHLGPAAFPALINGLSDSVPVIRMKSAYALGEFGAFAKEALPPLTRNAGKDQDVFARCDAIDALGKMGPVANVALAPLMASLEDPSPLVRFHAVETLGEIGPQASPSVPGLIKILNKDPDVYTRGSAAKSLGQMGALASTATPDLIAASKEKDQRLKEMSVMALQQIQTKRQN